MGVNDNAIASEWCRKTRTLLHAKALGLGGDRGRLDEHVKRIDSLLKACLKAGMQQVPKFAEVQQKYWKLADKAEEIHNSARSKQIKETETKALDADLAALGTLLAGFRDYGEQWLAAGERRHELSLLDRDGARYSDGVADLMTRAQTKADAEDFAGAAADLERGVGPEVKKQLGLSNAARAVVLDSARNKAVFEAEHRRIDEAIATLAELPGTGRQRADLEKLSDICSNAGANYNEALKAIKGWNTSLADGLEAAGKFERGTVDKRVAASLTALRGAIAGYKAIAGIGDAVGVAAEEAGLHTGMKALDDGLKAAGDTPAAREAAITAAVSALDARTDALKTKTADLARFADSARASMDAVRPKIEALKTLAPADALDLLWPGWLAAQALAGSQQHQAASVDLAGLKTRVEAAHALHTRHKADWQAEEAKLRTAETVLDEIHKKDAQAAAADPALFSVAGYLRDLIARRLRADLLAHRRYGDALALLDEQKVLDNLAGLRTAIDERKAGKPATARFAGDESGLRAEVGALSLGIEEHADAFEAVLQTLAAAGGHTGDYTARLGREVLDVWRAGVSPVTNESTPVAERQALLPGLRTRSRDLLALLDRMQAEAAAIPADPAALARSVAAKAKSALAAPFAEASRQARDAITYLAEYGAADDRVFGIALGTAALRTRYDELVADGTFAIPKMEMVASDARDKRGLVEVEMKKRHTASAAAVAELGEQIGKLRKSREDFAAFFDGLQSRLTAIAGMAASSVLPLMVQGEQSLGSFKTEIAAQIAAFASAGGVNFASNDKRRSALRSAVDSSDLRDYQPLAQATLLTEIKELLPDRLKRLSPAEGLAEIQRLEVEKDKLVGLVDKARLARADLDRLLAQVAARFAAQASMKTAAPALHADLKRRIEAAGKAPKRDISATILELRSIELILSRAEDPARLDKMEKQTVTDAFEARKDALQFEGEIDLFEKGVRAEAKKRHDEFARFFSDRNDDLYDQIARLLGEARKAAEKQDHPLARDHLHNAEAAARAFLSDPYKPAVAARKSLEGFNGQWKVAIGGYLQSVASLKSAITAACTAAPYDAAYATTRTDALQPLQSLFDASQFDQAIATLGASLADPAQLSARRATKEKAIAALRGYEALLEKNLLLRAAAGNPFGVAVPVAPLKKALSALNGALLAA